MLDKILSWFSSIPQDKLLHILAGVIIGGIVERMLRDIIGLSSGILIFLITFAIVFICGYLKEYLVDKVIRKSVPDNKDMIATALGGLLECLIML